MTSAVWTVRRRGSTRQWRVRREWWAKRIAAGAVFICPRCSDPILPSDPWDLDHYLDDDDSHTLPAHRTCNIEAGLVKLGARQHGLDVRDGKVVQPPAPAGGRAATRASGPAARRGARRAGERGSAF